MWKKSICLISFVFVLGPVSGASADLVAHWKFNNDGTDSIGAADCTLQNGASYSTDSKEGSHSLSLDGIDDYAIPTASGVMYDPFREETVAIWFKAASTSGTHVLFNEGGWTNGLTIRINAGTLQAAVRIGTNQATASTSFASTEWTHVAVTFDNGSLRLYVNGAEEAAATAGFSTVPSHTNASGIGARNAQDAFGGGDFTGDYFSGLIDDVQMYDNALSAAEIAELLAGHPKARDPNPADGATHTGRWVSLSWTPGAYAGSHNVYLGDNFDQVNDGTGGTFQGNQTTTDLLVGLTGYAYPDGLEPGTTYYWRIDEVNDLHADSPWKGSVWSFAIAPRTAYDPDPFDGARFVDPDGTLSWTAGMGARLHHVYIGRNLADVEAGTGGTYKGPVAGPSYTLGGLARDTLYYWRIDQFDGSATYKGDIWRFRTLPEITVTDPNLVGWWKFDRGFGTTALDWSGHGNDGTLQTDLRWVAGYDGDALEFNGNDCVSIDGCKGVLGGHAFSITAWISAAHNGEIVGWGQPTNGQRVEFRVNAGVLRCEIGGGDRYVLGRTSVWDNEWHHVGVTVKENATISYPDVIIYLDGEDDTIPSTYAEPFDLVANYDVTMGQRYDRTVARFFSGLIDDVRIYDKALTQAEIKGTMRGDPLLAWDPSPAHGSGPDVEAATPLTWSPGDKASQHDVYFGTDRDAVENADTSTAGIYRRRQPATAYTPPEGVEWGGGPYYWRIDEYNTDGTLSKGRVWSFTVADFILVDDFEAYAGADVPLQEQIWFSWHDGLGYGTPDSLPYYAGNGSGAAVGDETTASYTEETIVHSDQQALPYEYNNNKQGYFNYSEAQMPLSTPRDWTKHGVKALSLWFRGVASNAAEPMYVALNGSATAYHDNPNAAQIDTWTEWHIDLKDFADQGINLKDVDSVAIGFGDRNNPQVGGSGKMYFDDIRLYRPRCVPDKVTLSAADLNSDCVVDMADVEIMAGDWLAVDPALAADLNADSSVDFNDYAALADQWLDEQLWPEW